MRRVLVASFYVCCLVAAACSHADDARTAVATNVEAADVGALRNAIDAGTLDARARQRAIWRLADLQRQSGNNREALQTLALATPDSDVAIAETALRTSAALHGLGRYDEAATALDEAEGRASALTAASRIALAIQRGNIEVERGAFDAAAAAFDAAARDAVAAGTPDLEARARLNEARLRIDRKYLDGLEPRLRQIGSVVERVPEPGEQARLYVGLGELFRRAIVELDSPIEWRAYAHMAFGEASRRADDDATRAWALGYLGTLYEDEGRRGEALASTREALFIAQRANAEAQRYRWEWQLGRLLLAEGRTAEAEAALGRAVAELDAVRGNFALGSRTTFLTRVAPVYTQYADVLLARSATTPDGDAQQATLSRVRDVLESLKRAEVEDYFASECITRRTDPTAPATTGAVAIVYPVLLDDRAEILVEVNGKLAQFATDVSRREIVATVRRFRLDLERPFSGTDYLADAQRLYRWLIAPVEPFLAANGATTLVIVPDGALRTIPPAALHDGSRFLIERYAIASTPALDLTADLARPSVGTLLVGGLSEGVQGFEPLPAVAREVDTVAATYPGLTLRDASFRREAVETELERGGFSVAHFATHGEFSPDYRQSFILTYDDKLTLNGLKQALENRVGEQPLDLLVLSACKTAAGDDRAALGLAGVAVQSGAQSALASLWSVSDAATADLIAAFYDALKAGRPKAESLRAAQLSLLGSGRFAHPSYWAPYLLIGNWL